jgi:hypothetical protein
MSSLQTHRRTAKGGRVTQPFDNRDWDQRQIAEKDVEIERLKLQFQKASEWNQFSEIQIKNLQNIVEAQNDLLVRAAEALEEEFGVPNDPAYGVKGPVHELITELRKAAQ